MRQISIMKKEIDSNFVQQNKVRKSVKRDGEFKDFDKLLFK